MSDPSAAPAQPQGAPPQYQSAPPAQGFPAMPKNPAAAFGAAGGYFASTSPSMLAIHALILMVTAALLSFINGFISIGWLSNIIRFPTSILEAAGMVVLVVAGARFVADAFRGK